MTRGLAALVLVAQVVGVLGVGPPASAVGGATVMVGTGLRPRIVQRPIPFGDRRKRQMARYSRRHYGGGGWRLQDPQVIVEHYTDGTSFSSAWNHFAANGLHNGEKPGVCAHFIIDRDGTIYQLVPLDVRCRHAVGLNYTSIGIEHVGTSDAQVLGNRRQMRASLRLTVWLMAKFDVNIGDVIGHAEALESPYHHELYPDWRCLVHADLPHAAMRRYRPRLRDRAAAEGVRVGAGPVWQPSGC